MTLNLKTGRAICARPKIHRGGNMIEKKTKEPDKPYALQKDGKRIRVCGKWQKKGYKASDEEQAKWKELCKNRGWDPKTGKPKVQADKKK